MKKIKRYFYFLTHLNFISGFLYAFYHFVRTPRSIMINRRMWAYESWIILSFYSLFIYLILIDKGEVVAKKKIKERLSWFKQTLLVNLVLLVFPWGVFLLASPGGMLEMLGLNSIYWRILGGMSLLGAIIYYLPYQFYKKKISYYVLIFGFVDNLLAGAVVTFLFLMNKIPLLAFSATPLLFYFSFFFFEQARDYRKTIKLNKKS
jgi:hypothetical protein